MFVDAFGPAAQNGVPKGAPTVVLATLVEVFYTEFGVASEIIATGADLNAEYTVDPSFKQGSLDADPEVSICDVGRCGFSFTFTFSLDWSDVMDVQRAHSVVMPSDGGQTPAIVVSEVTRTAAAMATVDGRTQSGQATLATSTSRSLPAGETA